MLKIITVTAALIAVVSFTAPGFDATAKQATTRGHTDIYVTGTVMSVDSVTNEVVIKEASGIDHTIVVGAKDASTLKTGDKVKVRIKRHTNTAVRVTPLVEL